jgi:hypothetical protein
VEFQPVLERLSRFLHAQPQIAADVYIAPNATIIGSVSIKCGSGVRPLAPTEQKGIEELAAKYELIANRYREICS